MQKNMEKQIKNENIMENTNNTKISPISWMTYLTGGAICSGAGIASLQFGIMTIELSQYQYGYNNSVIATGILFAVGGIVALVLGAILFWLFIRELIADANVRALEVFYGKKRTVAKMAYAKKKNKATTNWVKRAVKNLADDD